MNVPVRPRTGLKEVIMKPHSLRATLALLLLGLFTGGAAVAQVQ
jgi:hypothetical protein